MNRWVDIRVLMVAWLILLVAGCSDDAVVEPEESQFKMYIYFPEQEATTRGEYDIVSDRENENKINTLQVWVFACDEASQTIPIDEGEDKTDIGSLYVNVDNLSTAGGLKEVSFYGVSKDFKVYYPYLNVYAIANAASLGLNLNGGTTEEELQELTISGDHFGVDGTTKEPLVTSVDDAGLPMSACVKKAPVCKQNELFSIANLTLTRAVSKIRFVFSKANNIPNASVSKINLDGHVVYSEGNTHVLSGVIPENEYLFSDIHEGGDVTGSFLNEINFDVPTAVPEHENPWILRWEHEETRQEWEDKINNAIAAGKAVECGRAYLRESPYRLTGKIVYSYQETEGVETNHEARFTMLDENEFLRGHSWTVFAYFSEGGVVFEVDGWDKQEVSYPVFK